MLRASLRACSTLSRVAALAVPRPPLLAVASVRDRPSSSLQSWSVGPPPSETPPREPLLLGGLLGACPARPPAPCGRGPTRGAPYTVAGLALDLPGAQGHAEQMEMGRGPRRTGKQWEHLVKTRKFVKCAPPPPLPHMRPPPLLAPPLPRPRLRTPSALRAPGLTLGPAPTLLHGERHRARERGTPGEATSPTLCPHTWQILGEAVDQKKYGRPQAQAGAVVRVTGYVAVSRCERQ